MAKDGDSQKLYSLHQRGGNTSHLKFVSIAPEDVRDLLKASKHCMYIQPRKLWVCKDKGVVARAEGLLTKQGWKKVKDVVPELAPLSVDIQDKDKDTILLAFNRKPEDSMQSYLKILHASPTDDKRVWTASTEGRQTLRRYFTAANVAVKGCTTGDDMHDLDGEDTVAVLPPSTPAKSSKKQKQDVTDPVPVHEADQADVQDGKTVTMAVDLPNKLVLQFDDGLPDWDWITKLREALSSLGVQAGASVGILQKENDA